MAYDITRQFEDRAYENYGDEMKEIAKITRGIREGDRDAIESWREPLSVEEARELTIVLSCGGPSDGYKIYFNRDGKAVRGYYFFAEWLEYKEFKLADKELDRVLMVYPVAPDC